MRYFLRNRSKRCPPSVSPIVIVRITRFHNIPSPLPINCGTAIIIIHHPHLCYNESMQQAGYQDNIQPYAPRLEWVPFKVYKTGIRHDVMLIVVTLFAYFTVQTIASSIITILQMALGGGFARIIESSMANLGSGEAPPDMAVQLEEIMGAMFGTMPGGLALTQILSIVLSFPVFFIVAGKLWFSEYVPKVGRRMDALIFLQLFALAMGAQLVFSLAGGLINSLLEPFGLSMTNAYDASINQMLTPIGLAYIIIIGPVSEELIFRGAIMRRLEKHGANFAILLSSAFFALYHMIIIQMMFAFIVGLVLGYTTQRYSLKWAILLHTAVNGLSIGLSLAFGEGIVTSAVFFACFAAALLLLILRRRYIQAEIAAGRTADTMQFPEMLPRSPEGRPLASPYKIAFSSVFMILYIAFTVLMGLYSIVAPLIF